MMKRILGLLFFTLLAGVASAERSIDLGTISRIATGRTVPVYWDIKTEAIKPILDRALSVHGGLVKVSPDSATVIIEFRQLTNDVVELQLLGTKPRRVIYSEQFSGGKLNFVALKAADRAVQKILGTAGFYTGKIAFISDRTGRTEVYIGDLFFQNVRQITSDGALAMGPKLSPDGRALTYTGFYRGGFPDVLKIDLASGRRSTIASFKGLNTGGSWAPQGDRLALTLSSSGNSEVYLAQADGGRFHRLTRTNSVEASPSFSPEGARVVFASDLPGKPQLYVMDVAGGVMQRLPTAISSYCAEPVWNPTDPNLIAFTVAAGSEFEIAVYDMAKRQSKIVSRGSGDAIEPAWLNDGRHLIYTARTGTTRQLYLLDTETGKASPLNSTKFGKCYQASFSAK